MKSVSTYDAILDLAEALVQKRGFNGFSYRDLAEPLGIRTASVHYHFPTKADLGKALVVRYGQVVNAALAQIVEQESDLRPRLARYAGLYLSNSKNGEQLCLCVSLTADFETLDPSIRQEVQAFWRNHEEWLSDIMSEGSGAGGRVDAAARGSSTNVLRSLQGAMVSSRVLESSEPIENTRDWIIDTYCG